MAKGKLTGYDLSRQWFAMAWERHDVTANHTSLYLFLCHLWNKIGQPETFQITSTECMRGMSAKSYNTYKRTLDFLKEMGCIKLIKQSRNQYQCSAIALVKFDKAPDKALDKALATFIKPLNNETIKDEIVADVDGENLFDGFRAECLDEFHQRWRDDFCYTCGDELEALPKILTDFNAHARALVKEIPNLKEYKRYALSWRKNQKSRIININGNTKGNSDKVPDRYAAGKQDYSNTSF